MNKQPTQLTLGIRLSDEAKFDNYLVSAANKELVESLLKPESQQHFVYIRAGTGAGLSHLLQALCHVENLADQPGIYLPMAERRQFEPAILEGVGSMGLVCIDDLDAIAGDEPWERALFTAFNELAGGHGRLVIAAHHSPGELDFGLADLRSRLQLAPVFRLHDLDDEDKKQLLQLRAAKRGMNLSRPVADYILNRTERTLESLMAVLEKLDASSLTHQRPLTVPLVRETLGFSEPKAGD